MEAMLNQRNVNSQMNEIEQASKHDGLMCEWRHGWMGDSQMENREEHRPITLKILLACICTSARQHCGLTVCSQ